MNIHSDVIRQALKGKSILRILSQQALRNNCPSLNGRVIDLGSGGYSSYRPYLNFGNCEYLSADINLRDGIDLLIDLTKKLPLDNDSFNFALLFNCLYIFEEPVNVLEEVWRIIKPGGKLLLITPFIFNEAPEPTDYWRFTSQGLGRIVKEAGFSEVKIIPFGERFSAVVSLLNKFLFFGPLRALVYLLAISFDRLVPVNVKKNHPCSLGYLTIATK